MMMALWSAALWLIDMVFGVIDKFTAPNVADPGLGHLYGITLWMSFVVALIVGFGQIGLAAVRRDGRSLGSLAIGVAQYGAVVTGWVAICAGLILGCAGLTRGLLHTLLHIDGFAGYSASAGMTDHVTGTVQAAVLGMCALFLLIPAAFGYLLITLFREVALLILTATLPIAAAGALGEGTRVWLWKSVRWFTAACLTAPLLALVLGIGVQIPRAAFPGVTPGSGQAAGRATGRCSAARHRRVRRNVGMAVVGCVIFLVACFCPMVLFRLLAFVDPGTASGASFRSTLAANGGVSGLLSGRRGAQDGGTGAAIQVTSDGRAASESSADTETANRFQSKFAHAFGAAGKVAGGAMDTVGVGGRTRRVDDGRRDGPGRSRAPGLLRHDPATPDRWRRTAPDAGRARLGSRTRVPPTIPHTSAVAAGTPPRPAPDPRPPRSSRTGRSSHDRRVWRRRGARPAGMVLRTRPDPRCSSSSARACRAGWRWRSANGRPCSAWSRCGRWRWA